MMIKMQTWTLVARRNILGCYVPSFLVYCLVYILMLQLLLNTENLLMKTDSLHERTYT